MVNDNYEPKYKLLPNSQLEQLHEMAMKVLEEIGVKVYHQEALKTLENSGAHIGNDNCVKIPRRLVEDSLSNAPNKFDLYNRDLTDSITWGDNKVYFGASGSAIRFLDSDGKTSRNPTTKDLLRMYQLADALPEVSWLAPGFIVKDVPDSIVGIWRFYLRIKFGQKPSCADGLSIEDLLDNLKLVRIIRNDENSYYEKPFTPILAAPTPPLKWTEEGAGFLVEGARAKLPIIIAPLPFPGAGAPVTIAGSLVLHIAEALSGIVIVQTVSPGTPCVFAGAPAYMDMRYGTASLSTIEGLMIQMGATQMGKFYNLPTGTGDITGHSDSKLNDFQAGAESCMSQVLMALAGNNATVGMGFLESQGTYSLEKLVADHEVCRFVKRLLQGVDVSSESLAFDVIKAVGPGGDFLSQSHTLKFFKKEYLFPTIYDRKDRENWETSGAKDTHTLAKEYVDEILAASSLSRLTPEVDRELDEAWI